MPDSLFQLWAAAALLAGFHVAAFAWRLKRETYMEQLGQRTWLTVGDHVTGVSFLLIAVGVFVAPVAGAVSVHTAAKLLGVAATTFAVVPFIMAAHYNLYCSWGKGALRDQVTKQEWVAIGVSALLVASIAWWIFG